MTAESATASTVPTTTLISPTATKEPLTATTTAQTTTRNSSGIFTTPIIKHTALPIVSTKF